MEDFSSAGVVFYIGEIFAAYDKSSAIVPSTDGGASENVGADGESSEAADVFCRLRNIFLREKLEHYGASKPVIAVSNGVPKGLVDERFVKRKMIDGDVLENDLEFASVGGKADYAVFAGGGDVEVTVCFCMFMAREYVFKKAKRHAEKHHLKVKFLGAEAAKINKRMQEVHLGIMDVVIILIRKA